MVVPPGPCSVRLSLATEVVDNTQTGMHCLKFGSGSTELKMMQQVRGRQHVHVQDMPINMQEK